MSPTVRALEAPDVPAVAALLADAFEVDAAYRALFPGPERRAGLRDLFRRNLAIHLPYRCTFVGVRDGEVVATLTIRPPGGVPTGLLTLLRHGALPFLRDNGFGAMRRLLWIKRTYERLEDEAAGHEPHWHLHMMAVAPEAQGTGVGSRVLSEAMDRTIHPDAAHAAVLTTHLERNLPFYRRVGFEVIDVQQIHVPTASEPYPVWIMRRPPT